MIQRLDRESNAKAIREAGFLISVCLMILGAIVLGHNAVYGHWDHARPLMVNLLHILNVPLPNLLIGLPILTFGFYLYWRNR